MSRTTNVRNVFHCELTREGDGNFCLSLSSGGEKKTHIHLERWWIGLFASEFLRYLKHEEEEISRLKGIMRGS